MDVSGYDFSALLEAVLFASPEPVAFDRLCSFFEKETGEVSAALSILEKKYEKENSGITLVKKGDHYTVSTKLILGEAVAKFLQTRKSPYLSNAALEVLAIAAYNRPVTKTYVSQIRGVPSSEIVESLVEKKLLKENGRLDLPGRPMSYVTTDKFLTVFGLESIEDLPEPEALLPEQEEDGRTEDDRIAADP